MQNTVKPCVAVTSTHLLVLHTGQKFVGSGSLYKSMGLLQERKTKLSAKMKYKHGFLFGNEKIFNV